MATMRRRRSRVPVADLPRVGAARARRRGAGDRDPRPLPLARPAGGGGRPAHAARPREPRELSHRAAGRPRPLCRDRARRRRVARRRRDPCARRGAGARRALRLRRVELLQVAPRHPRRRHLRLRCRARGTARAGDARLAQRGRIGAAWPRRSTCRSGPTRRGSRPATRACSGSSSSTMPSTSSSGLDPNAVLAHAHELGGELIEGLRRLGLPVITPEAPDERAGNVCFLAATARGSPRAWPSGACSCGAATAASASPRTSTTARTTCGAASTSWPPSPAA